MGTFFSYTQMMSGLVQRVRRATQSSLGEIFIYEGEPSSDANFLGHINGPLMRAQTLVVFIADELGEWQCRHEIPQFWPLANKEHPENGGAPWRILYVVLCSPERLKEHLRGRLAGFDGCNRIYASSPDFLNELARLENSAKQALLDKEAMFLAKALVKEMRLPWRFIDGLPADPHLFEYEKDIIDHFADAKRLFPNGCMTRDGYTEDAGQQGLPLAKRVYERWLDGCPAEWPQVKDRRGRYENRFTEEKGAAQFRPRDACVLVKALIRKGVSPDLWLTIPEAGPRELLHFAPDEPLRVGIMVSGGIAPGINAVIDGIVQRHTDYANAHRFVLNVYGFQDGFLAFEGGGYKELVADHDRAPHGTNVVVTSDHAHQGGSVIGTSRVDGLLEAGDRIEQLEDCDRQLDSLNIDILYVIGGDGTMKAAHALHEVSLNRYGAKARRRRLSVVAIPKTMDNDVLWVWQSFGFLSAVEKAREIIEHLSTEVESNPRVCIVQLFGSDSGFVVSHAVLASATGHCVLALIPEVDFSMSGIINYLRQRIWPKERRPPRGIIVMAETAIPTDAEDFINHDYVGLTPEEKNAIHEYLDLRRQKRRIQGQTDDALRSAGLKIVKNVLARHLAPFDESDEASPSIDQPAIHPDWSLLRVVTNEPRHLLRAIPPSCLDIIFGQRLGTLAVDNALAGYTDFMISQWLTEYVLVPLQLVVLGRKRIPRTGIFWKSILAKTGQPADLDLRGTLKLRNENEVDVELSSR